MMKDIEEWAKAFVDFHPVAEQRTPKSIKAWAIMGKVDEQAISAVVRWMIANQPGDPAKAARMQGAHERVVAARRRAAVYDGDVVRACEAYYVGAGWHAILDDLVREFAEINNLGFLAAHEKWGELKVAYLYDGDRQDDADVIERRARDRSLVTCWYCGQPGKLKQERWWRVRCDEHWSAE